jgi:hypothetical protein
LIHGKYFEVGDENRNPSPAQAARKRPRSRIPEVLPLNTAGQQIACRMRASSAKSHEKPPHRQE